MMRPMIDYFDAEIIATLERWQLWMQERHPDVAQLALRMEHHELVAYASDGGVVHRAALPVSLPEFSVVLGQYCVEHNEGNPALPLAVGVLLDPVRRRVDYGTHFVELTEKEYDLLHALYHAGEDGITKEDLLHHVWGYHPDTETHTLDTHLYRLRQKLTEQPMPMLIEIAVQQGIYRLAVHERAK